MKSRKYTVNKVTKGTTGSTERLLQDEGKVRKCRGSRCLVLMTVCLGLICVLLLVFITLQHIIITAERDLLKNTVEEFTHTINRLQDKNTDLMTEKDQLKNNFNSLSQTKLELETRVNDLSAEKSQLQGRFDALNQTKLELETELGKISTQDPCYNYTVLDNPWRSINNTIHYSSSSSSFKYDSDSGSWSGWYRLFINGMSAHIPDTCVPWYSCGTLRTLWIRGGHPTVTDGVVTRELCGHSGSFCCSHRSYPIKVKACPGDYYVYELIRPTVSISAYCADTGSINTSPTTVTPVTISPDPCYNYTVLDNPWRSINNTIHYSSSSSSFKDDSDSVSWSGWYRLFINGMSAHIPDTCVAWFSCGTITPLWIRGGHPTVTDGVVTRELCGHDYKYCCSSGSYPIKVKACPGDYYVYELVRPAVSISAYCADTGSINTSPTTVTPVTISTDPCYNYTVLDNPWRSINNKVNSSSSSSHKYDSVSWSGWYRLFINSTSAHIPDTCVARYSCGTYIPLWIRGGHPTVTDGVVTRDVCGYSYNYCCSFGSYPIKVKACPGDYYVYELVRPTHYPSAYCADTGSINTSPTTVTPVTISPDPCYNYTVLDNPWRSINNKVNSSSSSSHKYDSVSWSGWYRLFINNTSAHISDTCVAEFSCGTYIPLWIRGGHPTVTDGVVTRDVCGNGGSFCCFFGSFPIKVKACPGDYYVYELVRPTHYPSAYCADTGSINTSSTTVTPVTISPGKDRFFISSEWLSWSGSRQFCRDRGADLVIINTEEKQRYITSLAKESVWIGLTDIETEGIMKWVDNSTLKQGFWYKREPNNAGGDEDCVELTPSDSIQNWNDLPCFKKRKAVCEK
ncbi:uncharacterized protein LOC120459701 isoform X2 [Pimephales promelas]|uniref:uncharacterized protein LOC120459701 isoform X2 n=1 Tax=Pimephales promelas TaxID=90988 RepID=UPI001955B940|nr:uncharacterized protein LOC120459701 isoform X2 [Pimephales promelas]